MKERKHYMFCSDCGYAFKIAKTGDYIIKGVKGEIYPCKTDIFEETYFKL